MRNTVTFDIDNVSDFKAMKKFCVDLVERVSVMNMLPFDDPNNPSEENCPDWSLEGDSYDCVPYDDDVATTDCNEADCVNGDRDCEPAGGPYAYDGDLYDANLAFCLGTETVQRFTKTLPYDVACGD